MKRERRDEFVKGRGNDERRERRRRRWRMLWEKEVEGGRGGGKKVEIP